MNTPSVRLDLAFHLDLSVPIELAGEDPERLKARLADALGTMVLQGLPVIAGKQLAKADIAVTASAFELAVRSAGRATSATQRASLIDAGPHLTDEELDRLAAEAGGTAPAGTAEDEARALRRKALAIANEFRLVPCAVQAELISGGAGCLMATLNLTNGSVMVDTADRHKRLQPGQGSVAVAVGDTGIRLEGAYAGHTISGPVIEVPVKALVPHRDALIELWQRSGV